jgi:hypothetical protein
MLTVLGCTLTTPEVPTPPDLPGEGFDLRRSYAPVGTVVRSQEDYELKLNSRLEQGSVVVNSTLESKFYEDLETQVTQVDSTGRVEAVSLAYTAYTESSRTRVDDLPWEETTSNSPFHDKTVVFERSKAGWAASSNDKAIAALVDEEFGGFAPFFDDEGLPDRKLTPGESWDYPAELVSRQWSKPGMKMTGSTTVVFRDLESVGGLRFAVLDVEIQVQGRDANSRTSIEIQGTTRQCLDKPGLTEETGTGTIRVTDYGAGPMQSNSEGTLTIHSKTTPS